MKIFDYFSFVLIIIASVKWYMTPYYFDILMLASLMYCAFRRRENVNIISLCLLLIIFKVVNAGIMSGAQCMRPIVYFSLMAFMNLVVLGLIWTRPITLSQIGPFKHRTGWTITKADDMIGLVFILMIIFDILLVIEQLLRYLGFDARWFYDMYEVIQLSFAVISISVLLGIVTNDKTADKSKVRSK
jgi:uncharacterized membrane protein